MERRKFIAQAIGLPVVGYAVVSLVGCGRSVGLASTKAIVHDQTAGAIQSFAYYEGLEPDQAYDQAETDGTTYNMPCISPEDIAAAVDKTYKFWHGHDGMDHMFTITADDFKQLQQAKEVLVYTTVVEDHRHCLLVTPGRACESHSCPT